MPDRVTYNAQTPVITQNDTWSCAPTSLRWAMTALGRHPTEQWIESTMIAEGVVSINDGLLDGHGAGLAAFIRRQYGEFGFDANNEDTVTFDALAAEIGPYPMLIGGHHWAGPGPGTGHWSALRGYDAARGVLLLANPGGTGPLYGGQEMTRDQFRQRGSFSMVRVLHPDLLG
jgi:hypothetical protein